MIWTDFINKKVYVQVDTVSGLRIYKGIVLEVNYLGKNTDKSEVWFILMEDMNGSKVGFPSTSIKLIDEEKR